MVTTRALRLGALQKQRLVSPVLAGCLLDQSVCPSAQLGDHSNDCQAHDPAAMDLQLPLLLGLGVSATNGTWCTFSSETPPTPHTQGHV